MALLNPLAKSLVKLNIDLPPQQINTIVSLLREGISRYSKSFGPEYVQWISGELVTLAEIALSLQAINILIFGEAPTFESPCGLISPVPTKGGRVTYHEHEHKSMPDRMEVLKELEVLYHLVEEGYEKGKNLVKSVRLQIEMTEQITINDSRLASVVINIPGSLIATTLTELTNRIEKITGWMTLLDDLNARQQIMTNVLIEMARMSLQDQFVDEKNSKTVFEYNTHAPLSNEDGLMIGLILVSVGILPSEETYNASPRKNGSRKVKRKDTLESSNKLKWKSRNRSYPTFLREKIMRTPFHDDSHIYYHNIIETIHELIF